MSKQKKGNQLPADGASDLASKLNVDPEITDVKPVDGGKFKAQDKEERKVKTVTTPKQVFNTSNIAKPVTSPSVQVAGRSLMALLASGTAGENGMTRDRSSVLTQGNSDQATTRLGKKTLTTARKIRTIVSEQVESAYKTTKPLAASGDSVQGANAQPYNKHFHSQKVHGSDPRDFAFERSFDFITRDEVIYADGQYITPSNTVLNDSVFVDGSVMTNNPAYDPDATGSKLTRGNFLHRNLRITIGTNKAVTLAFEEGVSDSSILDVSATCPADLNPQVTERGSKASVINANRAEIDRQNIESKAASHLDQKWSPLALEVPNPTGFASFMADIEHSVGAEMLLAASKIDLASAFVLNRTAKDGLTDTILPEIFNSVARKRDRQTSYAALEWNSASAFASGSSAWLLAVNDNIDRKYNFKSDLFLQMRGIPLLSQLLHQNVEPFKVRQQFANLFFNREMFSTINDPYDPYLPIYITDGEAIAHSLSFGNFIANGVPKYFSYTVEHLGGSKVVRVYHPLIKGIWDYLTFNAAKIRNVFNAGSQSALVIDVPMVHTTMGYSAWSLLLAAASPEVVRSRISSMYDVIQYSSNFGYPYSGFVDLSGALKSSYRNLEFVDREEPLRSKIMDSVHAHSWVMPELPFWTYGITESEVSASDPGTQTWGFVGPWYMSSESYELDSNLTHIVTLKDDEYLMAMPNLRSGTSMASLDSIFSITERDLRLTLDQWLYVPGMANANGFGSYKIGRMSVGQPVLSFVDGETVTNSDIVRTPRELGLSFVAPMNLLRVGVEGGSLLSLASEFVGSMSYIAYCYAHDTDAAPAVNGVDTLEMGEATGLAQVYYSLPAVEARSVDALSHGFVMSINDMIATLVRTSILDIGFKNYTVTILDPALAQSANIINDDDSANTYLADVKHVSLVQAIWTRLQRLPFIISPWDVVTYNRVYEFNNGETNGISEITSGDNFKVKATVSPFEFAWYFGLAGFFNSDYSEDVFNRLNHVQQSGMAFVTDPFVTESPLSK